MSTVSEDWGLAADTQCMDWYPDDVDLLELFNLATKAARRAGAVNNSEDVANKALLKMEQHGDFTDAEHRKAWVQRVAKNAAIDALRKQDRLDGFADDGEFGMSFSTELVASQKIRNLVEALPDRHGKAIWLTYYEGRSGAEVAEELGCSDSMVYKLLSEARSMLRSDVTAPRNYVR